jgi:hypothetical protein
MLEALKRLFQRPPAAPTWPAIEAWAATRGWSYKRARDGAGFVVECRFENRPWRLEWGESQRDYLVGHELRLRMDLELPGGMQLLLLSRGLMREMESETFERYTDHMQTHIDSTTPEEMRWLVMHPKLGLKPLPVLRSRIGAVGTPVPALARWLEGPLALQLERTTGSLLAADRPFVLMTSRNRVVLRLSLAEPGAQALDEAVALFEVAVAQTPVAVEGMSITPSEWASSASGWESRWHDDRGPPTR